MRRWLSRLLALSTVVGCAGKVPEPRPLSATSAGTAATTPDTTPASSHGDNFPTPRSSVCGSTSPLVVRVANETNAHGDLCAPFTRAMAKVVPAGGLGPQGLFELKITLRKLTFGSTPKCNLLLSLEARGQSLAFASGGATASAPAPQASGTSIELARDCVDVVMEHLLATNIIPAMQKHLASTPLVLIHGPPQPSNSTASGTGP